MVSKKQDNPTEKNKVVVHHVEFGFLGLLFIVLLLLKVGVVETTVMGWSWWWITSPFWVPISLAIGIVFIIVIVIILVFIAIVVLEKLSEK